MVHRIEVAFSPRFRDAAGESTLSKIKNHIGIGLDSVRVVEVYTLDGDLSSEEADLLREKLYTDPVVQYSTVDKPLADDFDYMVEVGFRPGVTDNVARTSAEGIHDVLHRKLDGSVKVYTCRQYLLKGAITHDQADHIASGILANDLIQRWKVVTADEWKSGSSSPLSIPEVHSEHKPEVRYYDLDVSDNELIRISREGVLALELDEMQVIKNYYADPKVKAERKQIGLKPMPSDVELEVLAQTWSEHCKHKIFSGIIEYTENGKTEIIDSLFKTYIKDGTERIGRDIDWLVSVFHDNAGIIKFDDEWNLVFKVETHNSPSALDPYGGALTGIVGVNRDPAGTGIGAKLIFNTDIFCFAEPDYNKPIPKRLMHPKRIFDGVRLGVEHGGNKSGIPTVNGTIVFDERYLGKPLVFCGTGGILPASINGVDTAEKVVLPGDLIVMSGGRIGKDGIHGATFSSTELDENSPVSAVQIGDPITQKKMLDFLQEARDQGLFRCITDNGAGGLSSSVGETARLSGGCEIELGDAPLKYAGLDPWEIFISEAQERMTMAVQPENIDEFMALSKLRGVESTVLGKYTDSGRLHVKYNGKTAAYIDMDFLHEGLPKLQMKARWEPPQFEEPDFAVPGDLAGELMALLASYNICSKEAVVRQYDHEVQGKTIVKPLTGAKNDGPSDAAVMMPVLGTKSGIVISNGINPFYSDIDTYHMAACVIDEAVRNIVAVGGDPRTIAGLDNFCWPDPIASEKTPDGEYKLAQLVRAARGLYDYTVAYGVPCISGKDSMKNDYKIGDVQISVPPTLLFSAIGKIPDVTKAITMDAKKAGDLVYVIGATSDELGGSQYFKLKGLVGNNVPKVDAATAKKLYIAMHSAIMEGNVASCHDCSDGGLAVALAETAFAGELGMKIDLAKVPAEKIDRDDHLLFSESQGRFVVTVAPDKKDQFEKMLDGNTLARVGEVVTGPQFTITGLDGKTVVDTTISILKEHWQKTLRGVV
jgi:phosphoribosylformylglycinamidine synthase subunit PurSL